MYARVTRVPPRDFAFWGKSLRGQQLSRRRFAREDVVDSAGRMLSSKIAYSVRNSAGRMRQAYECF